jgi:hypothetical protein
MRKSVHGQTHQLESHTLPGTERGSSAVRLPVRAIDFRIKNPCIHIAQFASDLVPKHRSNDMLTIDDLLSPSSNLGAKTYVGLNALYPGVGWP